MKRVLAFLVLLLIAVPLIACGPAGAPLPVMETVTAAAAGRSADASGGEDDAIVPSTTRTLPPATTEKLLSISPDGGTFTFTEPTPELQSLAPGYIMAGEPTTAAPDGFLRKVTHVSTQNGQVVVQTEETTLEEAIERGTIEVSGTITPADIQTGQLGEGIALVPGPCGRVGVARCLDADRLFFELKDLVLYDDDNNPQTTSDQIVANGSLSFEPAYILRLRIEDHEIKRLSFTYRMAERAEIAVESKLEVAGFDETVSLLPHSIPVGQIIVFVGGVPVVFGVRLQIVAGANGEAHVGLAAGIDQELVIEAGLAYENGSWQPVSKLTRSFGFQPPHLTAGGEVKGFVGPELYLTLYGARGPHAAVHGQLRLAADLNATPWWGLYAGVEVVVGIRVKMFGRTLVDKELAVIGIEEKIAEAETPPPMQAGDPAIPLLFYRTATAIEEVWDDGVLLSRCTIVDDYSLAQADAGIGEIRVTRSVRSDTGDCSWAERTFAPMYVDVYTGEGIDDYSRQIFRGSTFAGGVLTDLEWEGDMIDVWEVSDSVAQPDQNGEWRYENKRYYDQATGIALQRQSVGRYFRTGESGASGCHWITNVSLGTNAPIAWKAQSYSVVWSVGRSPCQP